jgi:Arc/MetJ-type ribon-helix-helix transcriptional regulator
MNVYLADADRRKVRELVSYLMLESGQRVSESQAIRAAINAAKSSKSLLDAFHPVSQTDLRYKR